MSTGISAATQTYRTALVLNNMAITLIERERYGPALKTVIASLSLMKQMFGSSAENSVKESQSSTEKLKAASARLAKYQSSAQRSCPDTQIESLEDDELGALRAAAIYGPSADVVFPVRISCLCCEDADPSTVARQFSTVLYNHALVCFLLSKQRNESTSGIYITTALWSFELADATLSSLLGSKNPIEDELPMLLFSMLVLNCLSLVYRKQGLKCKAEETERLSSITHSEVEEGFFFSDIWTRPVAAAAA